MSVRVMTGDCRDVLATLEAESVHCVVTSPPYWNLRDYGVEGQLGLEPTIDLYVENIIEVFRAVRRVLRKDGTVWLNLGSSYASSNTNPNQIPHDAHALSCDSDGTRQSDSQDLGSVYSCPDDEHLAEKLSHRDRKSGSNRSLDKEPLPHVPTVHGSERQDCASTSPGVSPLGALVSTTLSSSANDQGDPDHEATASVDRSSSLTFSSDGPASVHSSDCNDGTVQLRRILADRNWGKEPLALACLYLSIASRRWKAKDLINVPNLVAEALQCDGWYVRSEIIWSKKNPMPESVTDRPTSSHEKVFLLAKSARYFFDAEAVREPHRPEVTRAIEKWSQDPRIEEARRSGNIGTAPDRKDSNKQLRITNNAFANPAGRNIRNVWTIATAPFSQAHFATFPPALVEPCIKAGTSERGCCPECGAPWVREVVTSPMEVRDAPKSAARREQNRTSPSGTMIRAPETKTLGWISTCSCSLVPVPCTVLDPFAGAGTVGLVADRLGRNAILIEINPEYAAMAQTRIHDDAPLFAEVT